MSDEDATNLPSRRKRRSSARAADELAQRLELLSRVVDLAPQRLDDDAAAHAQQALESARGRLGHGTTHTVVALAGATGSGKSSTFNAILGEDLAPVGVRRPTTSEPRAAIVGGGAEGLLDWLKIPRRHVVGDATHELAGLVLVDLPDHDSTAEAHRAEVDRLVEVVDAFIWVVDPQKYADAALHEGYLRRFAGHSGVTLVALNQIDLLPEADRAATQEHLTRLLAEDGLVGVRVLPTSTTTGAGVDALRRELAARVAERRALVTRLDADLDWVASQVAVAVGDTVPAQVPSDSVARLARSLAVAAGVDVVADAAGAAHRHRSSQVAGWPPVRWAGRLRPDPLRRLGLDKARSTTRRNQRDAARTGDSGTGLATVTVGRTSRATPGVVAEAGMDEALRALVDRTATGLPDRWRRRLGDMAGARRAELPDALDRAIGSVDLPTQRPGWWSAASAAQWLFTALMVIGVVWLVIIGGVSWLGLPDLPTPKVGVVPVPTLLAVGGAVAGLILALVVGWVARVGGQRRSSQARKLLVDATGTVADHLVIVPIDAELAAMAELGTLARQLDR